MVSFDMVTPDWSRERAPEVSARLLRNIRTYQRWRGKRGLISIAICKLCVIRHRFWSVITGSDIPLNSNIGGGLSLPHPTGIIIHPSASIGVNCTILHQVTVGGRAGLTGLPSIGNEVFAWRWLQNTGSHSRGGWRQDWSQCGRYSRCAGAFNRGWRSRENRQGWCIWQPVKGFVDQLLSTSMTVNSTPTMSRRPGAIFQIGHRGTT